MQIQASKILPNHVLLIVDNSEDYTTVVSPFVQSGHICAKTITLSEFLLLVLCLEETCKRMHKNGMLHLDIKSENIFLHEGFFKLADFGLACSIPSYTFYGSPKPTKYVHWNALAQCGNDMITENADWCAVVVSLLDILYRMFPSENMLHW